MLRKDDAVQKVVDAMTNLYKSGQINAIYDKWFLKPVPPEVNLNVPMVPSSSRRSHREPDRLRRSSRPTSSHKADTDAALTARCNGLHKR